MASEIEMVEHESLNEAQHAAYTAAGQSAGVASPAVLFFQGTRTMLSLALQFRLVRERLETHQPPEGASIEAVQEALNRPEDADHSAEIARYIVENIEGKFILPPLTLNTREPVRFYTAKGQGELHTRAGFLLMPLNSTLDISDGQHRRSAIIKAYRELSREKQANLDRSSLAVMMTFEAETSQIHQDFADCSKTRQLAPSQLAVYDRRNPANGLVLDLIDRCPVFTNKVDSTSVKLSKKSAALFLTNQVRQVVKVLLVGSYAWADEQFEEAAKKTLGDTRHNEGYLEHLEKFAEYIDCATQAIPVLREIASLPKGLPLRQIVEKRQQGWVCLTATGINMIAKIGFEMFRDQEPNWRAYVAKFSTVDWRRSASIWQGNVVDGERVVTAHKSFDKGVAALRSAIGWVPRATGEPTPHPPDASPGAESSGPPPGVVSSVSA